MHWQECSNCHDKKGYDAHAFDIAGTTTKLPTETEEGEQIFKCVCGRETTKMIPVLTHKHEKNELKFDETSHWYTCKGEDCEEELEKEEHSFGEWIVSKQADCENDGSKWSFCSGCGNKITVKIDALGHDYG
ncbi:MAG: hypothetical protein K2N74_01660, partial [Clostridiales bacterium]|nr:hypothetical protein [Clostridiales bacterium]